MYVNVKSKLQTNVLTITIKCLINHVKDNTNDINAVKFTTNLDVINKVEVAAFSRVYKCFVRRIKVESLERLACQCVPISIGYAKTGDVVRISAHAQL